MASIKSTRATVLVQPADVVASFRIAGRRVLVTIFNRELQELGGSLRYRTTLFLIVALMMLSALVYAVRYRAELEAYNDTRLKYRETLDQGLSASELAWTRHPLVKSPWKLAFLADGEQLRVANVYHLVLSPWHEPELRSQHGADRRLRSVEPLDWLFFIRVLLSMAAFVLGYDAVCGRRQRAALKMTLSYAVDRWQVLVAKLLAIWICLIAPFLLGALISLLILTAYGGLRLTAGELAKIALVLLLALWAIAFFVLLALLTSILTREAARSLAILALIWVTMVVVIPEASGLLAQTIRPIPTGQEIAEQMDKIRRQVEAEHGGPGVWRSWDLAGSDDFAMERRAAGAQNLRYEHQEELRQDLAQRQLNQITLARDLASLSPMLLIQDLSERLVGSGLARNRSFLEQAWAFRDVLAAHVRELDQRDPDSPHILFLEHYMSLKPVDDPDAIPRFESRELSLREGLGAAGLRILLFGLATVILLAAVLLTFAHFDVGVSHD